MDTLLNFSGGIDSAWCLYNYLRRNPHKTLLVHHCVLRNWEGRGEVENEAVSNILEYLNGQGLTNYQYVYSCFDYGSIKRIVKDKEVIGFITGILLRDPKHESVRKVIISSNKEDASRRSYYARTEKNRKDIIRATAQREPEYVYPIIGKTRTELMATLPPELLRLTWYCRTPKDGTPCENCKTCRAVAKSRLQLQAGHA